MTRWTRFINTNRKQCIFDHFVRSRTTKHTKSWKIVKYMKWDTFGKIIYLLNIYAKKRAKCTWEGGLSLIYAFLTKPNAKNRPNVHLGGGGLLLIYVFLTKPNVPKVAQNGSFPKNIKPVTLPIREPRSRHYLNTYCKSRFSQFLRQTYLQRDF